MQKPSMVYNIYANKNAEMIWNLRRLSIGQNDKATEKQKTLIGKSCWLNTKKLSKFEVGH